MTTDISPLSSSTSIGDGETWTSAWELNAQFPDLLIGIYCDQLVTVYVDFSHDGGTTTHSTLTFVTAAGIYEVHRLVKGYRWMRLRIVNGSGATAVVSTSLTYGTFGPLTAPRNLGIAPDADSFVSRTNDYTLDQAQGFYSNEYLRRKFGRNPSVGTGASEMVNTLGALPSSFAGFLTAATTVRAKAGGSGDDTAGGSGAQAVTIEGLDENWLRASETITLAGTSASAATVTTFIRVLRAYVVNVGTYHGVNAGAITIEASGGSADLIQIAAGEGQSESCFDSIPANETAYLTSLRVDVDTSKTIAATLYKLENADDVTTPFSSRRQILRLVGLSGHSDHSFRSYIPLPEKTDIWLEAIADTNAGAITAGIEMAFIQSATG